LVERHVVEGITGQSITQIRDLRLRQIFSISTNTTIGTPDGFAQVLRLPTEITQFPFSMADGNPVFPRGIDIDGNYIGVIGRDPGPVVVVVRSIFCQV
jgi:hypothetical protein